MMNIVETKALGTVGKFDKKHELPSTDSLQGEMR